MRQSTLLLAVLASLLILLTRVAYADSERILNPENGHYYQRIDTGPTKWNGAKAHCKSLGGGYLATITSQTEAQFVHEHLNNGSRYTIGGTDQYKEGTWQWVTGELWDYTNWKAGEPNNCGFSEICGRCMPEDYIQVYSDTGLWNDVSQPGVPFICEWDNGSLPTISLTLTGCTTCRAGDRFAVQAHVTNLGSQDVRVEAKFGVRLPDGTPINLLGDRHLEATLPAGLDTTLTLFDTLVPPGLPTGTWSSEGMLLERQLGKTLSWDVKPFEVVP